MTVKNSNSWKTMVIWVCIALLGWFASNAADRLTDDASQSEVKTAELESRVTVLETTIKIQIPAMQKQLEKIQV